MTISIQRLKEVLSYDKESGIFTRKQSTGTRAIEGQIAGAKRADGYVSIKVDKHRFYAHRLAWMFEFGEIETGFIDHINGNPSDNRISNLRKTTNSVNQQNQRKAKKNNKAGLLGVSPNGNGFMARIHINGKTTYLGNFETSSKASNAYLEAKRNLHEGCTI